MKTTIWITWESQRRTNELSKALDIPLFKFINTNNRIIRYFILSCKTIKTLYAAKPKKVIVQNPSIVLAFLVCALKKFFDYKVIVDRHSNFHVPALKSKKIKTWLFLFFSTYSIRNAELTIITNLYLKTLVETLGGTGFVLQDKLPMLTQSSSLPLKGKYNLVCTCSFNSNDEPFLEIIEAANMIPADVCIYITGNYRNEYPKLDKEIPKNIILTSFLTEEEFQSLLYCCDIVVALTTADHTLLCSAYEAASINKPIILSKKPELIDYFYKGAVYTENNASHIATAIKEAILKINSLKDQIKELKHELDNKWNIRFSELKSIINNL